MESGLPKATRLYVNFGDSVNALSVICKLFCGWHLRDRFGILNKHSELNWSEAIDPIPVIPTESLVISDLMDEQANKILDAHKDGDIVVSWSGGVDSTAVICALLKNGLEPNRLKVICAESSPDEYPWFYKYLINNGIQVNITRKKWMKFFQLATFPILILVARVSSRLYFDVNENPQEFCDCLLGVLFILRFNFVYRRLLILATQKATLLQ